MAAVRTELRKSMQLSSIGHLLVGRLNNESNLRLDLVDKDYAAELS